MYIYHQAIHAQNIRSSSLAVIQRIRIIYSAVLVRQLLQQESVTCDRLSYWMVGDESINICLSECNYVAADPCFQFKHENNATHDIFSAANWCLWHGIMLKDFEPYTSYFKFFFFLNCSTALAGSFSVS
jgi:hypothetical protein